MKRLSSRFVMVGATALIVGGAAVSSASIVLPPLLPLQEGQAKTDVKGEVTSVEVTNSWGHLVIKAGDKTSFTEKQTANLFTPSASYTLKDGKLTITVECFGAEPVEAGLSVDGVVDLVNSCEDDITLTMPANAPLIARTAVGNITTTGINAVQTLTSKQGNLVVNEATTSKISGVAGSGNVEMHKVNAAALTAKTGYGYLALDDCTTKTIDATSIQGGLSIDSCSFESAKVMADRGSVQITDLAKPASIVARSTKGEVSIIVPKGAYALTTRASETVFIGSLTPDPSSPHLISATSDDGGVTVLGQ